MSETNQQDRRLVGIEVSVSALKAVIINPKGEIISSQIISLGQDEDQFSRLIESINDLKSTDAGFEKVGIAVPGLISNETNRIVFSTHHPEQTEVDFIDRIKEQTGLEAAVVNDANAAAYGEFICGAGRGSHSMFYVTLGTGVGGAFIFNDEIWHGVTGYAGEFGYITLNSEGMKLEEVASAQNIVRRIKNRFHQDHTSSLVAIGEENITIGDVVREANHDDGFAQMMLERTGMYVGTGVAGVINLLNIERVVVGGDVMEAGKYILPAIVERARELSFAPSFEATRILSGELGSFAGAVGSALLTDR